MKHAFKITRCLGFEASFFEEGSIFLTYLLDSANFFYLNFKEVSKIHHNIGGMIKQAYVMIVQLFYMTALQICAVELQWNCI